VLVRIPNEERSIRIKKPHKHTAVVAVKLLLAPLLAVAEQPSPHSSASIQMRKPTETQPGSSAQQNDQMEKNGGNLSRYLTTDVCVIAAGILGAIWLYLLWRKIAILF
jgi:hypothetical protein